MTKKTAESVAETAYGKPLDKAIPYKFDYEVYDSIDEVKAKNDLPSDDEVVKFRNAQRLANARQQALAKALDDNGIVKPTLENDGQLRLKKMYDVLMANGDHTEATAKETASKLLGIDWASK